MPAQPDEPEPSAPPDPSVSRETPASGQGDAQGAVGEPDPAVELRDDPDLELLRRHVAGDPTAFAELFRANADRLWSVAFRLLHDAEDAADAVQEAMLSAHRRAATFRGESAVRTWLHRITVNAALDRLRRQAARPTTVPMPTTPEGDEREPPDPRDAHAEGELRLDIASGLARLPAALRAAVVLVDVEGLPVAQVSELLGVPVGTVKSRAARGRARLAAELGYLRPGNQPGAPAVFQRREVIGGGS
ncbi:RNA polymerase sigma factor SigM [Pseudofrankia inefficax]|uniref:RNA polymerase, sigma-24 subunit, ECF subfamily n=1 Tax=Pseudofrankia inefficax (strain DSM 45817 / CECT 9037 / DDB 130130 / EuI1c) TaxID=298654 RepID=E3IZW3_PSEI1|nr:RNA polymerase sigma factor SigM [Pseudofrankia inefficax]ADP85155.1 RNA polymerase, sigma-24 subunit, ECF subfamily [Pseudofrankia inefficax]